MGNEKHSELCYNLSNRFNFFFQGFENIILTYE